MRFYQMPSVVQGSTGAIEPLDRSGARAPLGIWANSSLLDGLPREPTVSGGVIAMWSGGMGDSQFESTPRTWMAAGRDRFARALAEASAWATARSVTIALRPHARHVLSDLPSILSLLGVQKGGAVNGPPPGIGVLLDPFSMLTASLLPAVEEHLERVLGVAAALPGIVGVVVCNVRRPGANAEAAASVQTNHDDGPPLERMPAHEGEIETRLIADAVRRHVPTHLPIVLEPPDAAAQLRALGLDPGSKECA